VKTLPDDVVAYKRTADFTETTVPAALRKSHDTKAGVWGRIIVTEGKLRYRILEPAIEDHVLDSDHVGVVEPQVPHEVMPLGAVRFHVEFLKRM
jgi:tellurite resistance-related uncharacterized protein